MTLVLLLVRYHLAWIVYLVDDLRNFVSDLIFWTNTTNKSTSDNNILITNLMHRFFYL